MKIYTSENFLKKNEQIYIETQVATGNLPPHKHEFIEIVFVYSGDGIHSINNVDYKVSYGSLLFINLGQTHSFRTDSKMKFYNIFIKPEFFSDFITNENAIDILSLTAFEEFKHQEMAEKSFVEFSENDLNSIENIIRTMLNEYKLKATGYNEVLRSLLQILLAFFLRKMLVIDNPDKEKKIISEELLRYIEEHYNEKIGLSELSAKIFYNPSYFSRIFKESIGMSFMDYITNIRINKACELLLKTDLPISEIALNVGCSNNSAFYENFKKIKGITPAQYKKQHCN